MSRLQVSPVECRPFQTAAAYRECFPGDPEEVRVANVQKQFNEFDGKIRLGRFDENQVLRDKRNAVRDQLDEKLPGVFEKHD